MALAESTGEAAWQLVIQWLFYITSVVAAVRYQVKKSNYPVPIIVPCLQNDVFKKAELPLSFYLVSSTIMSLISLTMAQYKVIAGPQ